MQGTITKKHLFSVARVCGIRKALRLLLSRKKTALLILVGSMAWVIIPQAYGELNMTTASSFDPAVQCAVFHRVASLLPYVPDPCHEQQPMVVVAEDMSDNEFAVAIGSDLWGDKRGNFYAWRRNVVILTRKRCGIDVLAHEFVHFFQTRYQIKSDPALEWTDHFEQEAVRIQRLFE